MVYSLLISVFNLMLFAGDRALHIEATPLLFKAVYNASSLMLDLDLASAKPGMQTVVDSWLRSDDTKKSK